ncbi:MAG: transcription-repair coupling factor [Clostridiales bacterium]|nr:transcription-repair coupling factor [Clostridiales bacterium]
METLFAPLGELEEYDQLMRGMKQGEFPVQLIGCMDTQESHMIFGTGGKKRIRLVITHNEVRAKELVEDLKLYDREVMYYPAKDFIFYSADVHGQAIVKERLKVIKKLLEGEPVTVVTTMDGGMDYCLPFSRYKEKSIHVGEQDILDLEELKQKLVAVGYENTGQVAKEGEFSVRGGIIDIFPLTEDCPYRIELWGDEVDNIRRIDVESQRSVENVAEIEIYPATEIFLEEDRILAGMHRMDEEMQVCVQKFEEEGKREEASRLRQNVAGFRETYEVYHGLVNLESYVSYFTKEVSSFFDYFKGEDVCIYMDEPARCIEKGEAVEYEFRESMVSRLEKGYILPGQMDVLFSLPVLLKKLSELPLVLMTTLDMNLKDFSVKHKYNFQIQAAPSYNNNFSLLAKDILRLKKNGYRVLVLSASGTRAERLCKDLQDYEINAFYSRDLQHELLPGEVMIAKGSLRKGFEYPNLRFVVMTEGDIFGGTKKKRKKRVKRYEGAAIHSFNDLKIGDYVVHENHGLGVYEGIEKIEVDHITKDYLKVAYAGGSNLYIPATSLELLQKYAGSDAAKVPKLNKLNSPEWKKTKTRVKGAVKEIAQELVDLYAKRQTKQGHAFEKDTVWQKEFEEVFPYEETEDQLRAIDDTKRDMESTKAMDRLICGDVGYGKTEIAIRAAFKAVMDGKQVAVLVPTTVLAGQHYNTFVQRMRDFSVEVGMLSRLRTPKENRQTVEKLKKGAIDIVIGTHRLLAKDVAYKDLGLLIVDEEQRFGVTHKEKLKQLKNEIDVLTLTATPIPRTLHMSLVGIRDMSVLEEPPVDRMPIQTFVMEKNDEIVREAILRELGRGGQVYYVYNRVANMDIIAGEVQKLVPEAIVSYAHGQMNERELERTMFAFVNGEIDVLVYTTIVETGLDIPNVNTIIIDEADKLGLSQLYQLRGRVGRSNRTAYAFLMYKRDKMLKEVAEKRLAAIKEFTELGSGFKISMRDLEIRGAGNLLGARQHGHMEAVGYDLYCKMLNEAVKRLKGEKVESDEFETNIDLKMDAFIPSDYIPNEFQKLDVYKRIAEIETETERDDMVDELIDRFGEPPQSVCNLLEIALLKAKAHDAYIVGIVEKTGQVRVMMFPQAKISTERIPDLLVAYQGKLRFVPEGNPYFVFQPREENLLGQLSELVSKIQIIKEENSAQEENGKDRKEEKDA